MELFGSSGARGVVGEELTPEFILEVAAAAGSVWNAERVALARDTRVSGRMLANAAASGLSAVGCDVDRLGVLPIPAAQAYAEREAVPAVMITASHNPPEYNGVKLIGADGVELSVAELETVERRVLAETPERVPWDRIGRERRIEGAREDYVEEIVASVDRERIARAELTVALDPGHGAGSLTSPDVFRTLGCRVLTVNAQTDGTFPGRNPEPVEENLEDLKRLVRTSDADVGIAHDGDADRAIFVDETGTYVEGDAALAALAAAELSAGDTTVAAVNVSQRLVDVASEAGAELFLTPIGSTNLITRIEALQEEGASVPIAGEGNGGIFFPNYRLARDGAYVAARFLELLADRQASEIVEAVDGYENVRFNLRYDSLGEREAMLSRLETLAHEAAVEVTTIDGYRFEHEDGWVLARASGTEPILRIYAEARERDRAKELAEELRTALETAQGED